MTNEELRAELRDERSERESAQRRAAQLAENVAIWRTRAEERSGRIERLEAEREQLRSVSGWLRAKAGMARTQSKQPIVGPRDSSPPDIDTSVSRMYRAYPSTTVGVVGVKDAVFRNVLAQFNSTDFESDQGILERADLVVWDPSTGPLAPGLQDRFEAWLSTADQGSRMVLLAEPDPAEVPLIDHLVRADREWLSSFRGQQSDWTIPTTFNPDTRNPALHMDRAGAEALAAGVAELISDDAGVAIRSERDWTIPWVVDASAAGIPFDPDATMSSDELLRDGAAGRRGAFRDRAPWHIASDLLERLGLEHRPPVPTVAAILVSNRPEALPDAIRALGNQSYPLLELVVGCHGFDPKEVEAGIEDAVEGLPSRFGARVMAFDEHWTLGRCLNTAIASTRGQVVAKIDDDDHYGPNYLEDAVQAMLYSGGSLIAKGAMFTYLESTDATILRRPKTVEQFYSGSPNGASMVFTRSLWQRVGFPDRTLGEDVAFGAGAALVGVKPYATSPWEFVYRRSVGGNTWKAVDEVFLEGSVPAWSGDQPVNAEISDP